MDPLTTLAHPLVLLLLLLTLGYSLACAVWPFVPCPRCHGSTKRRAPIGRAVRICRRCRGTGLRLRLGRRMWNHLRRHRTTTRTADRESA
jgi:DnaJ-class molecular chaperone